MGNLNDGRPGAALLTFIPSRRSPPDYYSHLLVLRDARAAIETAKAKVRTLEGGKDRSPARAGGSWGLSTFLAWA